MLFVVVVAAAAAAAVAGIYIRNATVQFSAQCRELCRKSLADSRKT